MAHVKAKLIFSIFVFLITFFFVSLIVSLSYLEVPDDYDSLDVRDVLDDVPSPDETFKFKNLHRKIKRVQALNLQTLKRSRHCQFECKPATDLYYSGDKVSLLESEPQVQIMILHCIHCLKSKGIMVKIRERSRRKRDIAEQMRVTPYANPTQSVKITSTFERSNDYEHNLFGGWISKMFQSSNYKQKNDAEEMVSRTRNLLGVIEHKGKRAEKSKVLKPFKKPIVVGPQDDDEDYENNYEDNFDSEVPDIEKQAQKTQDAITYFLIGSFAFFALLFMFVFPVASFVRMCCKNYDSNILIVSDVLRCRDPKYRLVKEMCNKCDIPIPDYRLYSKLMKTYKAKDAETVAKEERIKKFNTEESGSG